MNQTTKKQHYVWRHYLSAWTNDNTPTGQIICLRNNRVFSVSLTNIAHENYFYEIRELSRQERAFIYEMMIHKTTGIQRRINEQWLNMYCAPFDYANALEILGFPSSEHDACKSILQDQDFRKWNIEYIEQFHARIESKGMPYISLLRENRLDIWEDEIKRDEFSFFLSHQYFRTKKTRDVIVSTFERFKKEQNFLSEIRPECIWLPLSLIMASNVGVHLANEYAAVLLRSDDASFIVGDQPVINTHATFDMMTAPDKVELFYPITPHSALLLTKDANYPSGQVLCISSEEVAKYNQLEQKSAQDMVFAEERTQLEVFASIV